MPHWGLVITSFGFIYPMLIAYKNKKNLLGHALKTLTCTSLLFHGTHKNVFKYIDIPYVYCLVGFCLGKSVINLVKKHRFQDVYINIGTLMCLSYYFKTCHNESISLNIRRKNHMLFHALSQYLFGYYAAMIH